MQTHFFFALKSPSSFFFPFSNSLKFSRFHVDIYMLRDLQKHDRRKRILPGLWFFVLRSMNCSLQHFWKPWEV